MAEIAFVFGFLAATNFGISKALGIRWDEALGWTAAAVITLLVVGKMLAGNPCDKDMKTVDDYRACEHHERGPRDRG